MEQLSQRHADFPTNNNKYRLLLMFLLCASSATAQNPPLLFNLTDIVLSGIPEDPLAAGCVPVMDLLGYTCPVLSSRSPPELALLPAAGFEIQEKPSVMVLRDFPGYPFVGTPEVNFSLPERTPQIARFAYTAGFRQSGIQIVDLPSSVQKFFFPVFYSRINERWEPLEDCWYTEGVWQVRCEPPQDIFRKHAGLRLLMALVMSKSRAAVLDMLQNATAKNPDSKICVPSFDQLSRYCPSP